MTQISDRSDISHLLSSSEGVVKAGHVGHDGSFIGLWGVNDICPKKYVRSDLHTTGLTVT